MTITGHKRVQIALLSLFSIDYLSYLALPIRAAI
jgi:hypothetical protein